MDIGKTGAVYHLLLTAYALGNEMAAAFTHVFPVLFLQFLDVPVAMVSLYGVICGVTCVFLMPLLGRLASRNPLRSQLMAMAFVLLLLLVATCGIAISGILKISSSLDTMEQVPKQDVISTSLNPTTIDRTDETTVLKNQTELLAFSNWTGPGSSTMPNAYSSTASNLPARVYIAIVAFGLLDLAVTLFPPTGRIFVLECVPATLHRSLLLQCTTMGSIAGMAFAFLCTFDLPTMLGSWFNYDGTSVMVIFLPTFMAFVVTITFICSMLTGWKLYKMRTRENATGEASGEKEPLLPNAVDSQSNLNVDRNHLPDEKADARLSRENPSSVKETGFSRTDVDGTSNPTPVHAGTTEQIAPDKHEKDKWWAIDKRFILLFIAVFLAGGSMECILIYMPNAVTRDIYHGDPTALPGTEARMNYDLGLRRAATGSLIMFASYSVGSILSKKIVQVIGEDVLFLLIQVTYIASVLSVVIARTEATFFVTMAASGFIRLCLYTIAYLKTKAIIAEIDESSGGVSSKREGSILAAMVTGLPVHYLVLAVIMGPLLDATGNVWVPVIYGLVSSCVALVVYPVLMLIKR